MSATVNMHFRTEQPVLYVEKDSIIKIDPRKPENLFGMWSVFAKASGIIENGKRLENMSWRLWQQQTLCPKQKRKARPSTTSTTRPEIEKPLESQSSIPALSSSVESRCSSDSDPEHCPRSSCFHHRPACAVADTDVTSLDLQNLLLSIRDKQDLKEPLLPLPSPPLDPNPPPQPLMVQETAPTPRTSPPRPTTVESSTSTIESVHTDTTYLSPANASDTSVESVSDSSTHSVVRGFGAISSYKSQSQLAASPTSMPQQVAEEDQIMVPRNKGGVFQLGGSSGDEDGSVGGRIINRSRGSSLRTVYEGSSSAKKQTAFNDQITEIAPKKRFIFADDEDTAAIETDSEDDMEEEEISESAIDDDDEAWEDDGEEPEEPPRLTFPRVESKPDLVSRRSILTANLHQDQRATALQNAAARSTPLLRRSRTSTPNGPSMPASPTEESSIKFSESGDTGSDVPTESQPMAMAAVPSNVHLINHPPQPPMSPRAARRNMVSQELGVSLRKAMLNERQFKNLYANNATMRRAHTSTDIRRLEHEQSQSHQSTRSEEAGALYPLSKKGTKHNSGNDDFDHDLSDYHRKGW